jgi:rRNA-processing protein FCF1
MKTLSKILVVIIFATFIYACTADDTIEEQLNKQNNEVVATGDEGDSHIDENKD